MLIDWPADYSQIALHSALGMKNPMEYLLTVNNWYSYLWSKTTGSRASNSKELSGCYGLRRSNERKMLREDQINFKTVSIVTVVLNDRINLERTIKSVLSQTYKNKEHIILDGGSCDGTVELIQMYSQSISYWHSKPDKGIYDAMNVAIAKSRGEWIIFMNAGDTFYSDSALENALGSLSTGVIGFYGVSVQGETENINLTMKVKENLCLDDFFFNMRVCHQSILHPRKAFKDIGLYDLDFQVCADHEWLVRYISLGGAYLISEEILSIYEANGFSSQNNSLLLNEKRKIAQKYFGDQRFRIGFYYWTYWLRYTTREIFKRVGILPYLNSLRYYKAKTENNHKIAK